ncbi:MAG: organomercurial lyase [Acidimicrobiia bacterium]
MNAKSVEEIALVLRRMRDARDRIPEYRALVVDVVRELSLGMPVAPERIAELAAKHDTPERTIEEIGHSAEWSDGGIVGLNGLTLGDSRHRLHFDDVTMGTWCAWDSLFLVPIIGRAARLESTSPATNVAVEVSITPEGVTGAEPSTTVMSVVVPHPNTTAKTAAEVQAAFCHFVHFFEDRTTAESWVPTERDPTVLSPENGFRLGQLVYGDLAAV